MGDQLRALRSLLAIPILISTKKHLSACRRNKNETSAQQRTHTINESLSGSPTNPPFANRQINVAIAAPYLWQPNKNKIQQANASSRFFNLSVRFSRIVLSQPQKKPTQRNTYSPCVTQLNPRASSVSVSQQKSNTSSGLSPYHPLLTRRYSGDTLLDYGRESITGYQKTISKALNVNRGLVWAKHLNLRHFRIFDVFRLRQRL